ncbi:calcium-binding protein [Cohaesibacter sp. CAU 1516]|uniref:calcium-binding protein n=1 Tax=Cohaesibacter sp. CAU 1516 TaxID=2576038 RepID=UPI0010FD108F|nr:calcium-binding protein [Cohaesibacter sp. CAU 1516]TLP49141.1 calcium-binding protein [Cohaesibacter sp. CAU 1516]
MNFSMIKTLTLTAALLSTTAMSAFADGHIKNIGEVTALIPEASTAVDPAHATIDGASGDTAFPYISAMKPLATVGEVDKMSGQPLTGYPDGHSAWLIDENTVRIAYQSESYGPMSSETVAQKMATGATFTGSQVHVIDFDRIELARFLGNDKISAEIVKGSGHLYNRIFNVFGNEMKPKSEGGVWGNQTKPDGTVVDYAPKMQLKEADFFVNSFCGSWFEPANKYGAGIGFADDAYLMAEEWNIQRMFDTTEDKKVVKSEIDTHDTMGLASIVVDVKNQVAYTVPALGQTGYEKLAPLNPQHPDYVLIVASGYNHDVEPAPLKVYVGKKGVGVDGKPLPSDASERDQFLARNGLLYGKLYGLALANDKFASLGIEKVDTKEKMFDAYLTNADAPNRFDAVFAPTSYQWAGWDKGVSVRETEMLKWQDAGEQPEGHTFFVGDSKAEHPAVDPDITKTRYVQAMTYKGGLLGLDFGDMKAVFDAANGDLPATLPVKATRTVAAVDGALTIDVADKGIKHGGEGDHSTWQDGSAKTVAPDGLYWVKAADKDVLFLDEDSGNALGERKMALPLNAADMTLAEPGKGYLLAIAGGKKNPRAANKIAAYPGTFKKATSTEFSGSWNISSLIAKKSDGSFYTADELAGTGQQKINGTIALNDSTLIGVVQHKGESAGAVKEVKADQGGQLFIFSPNLPK